jgi:hypothetical protein
MAEATASSPAEAFGASIAVSVAANDNDRAASPSLEKNERTEFCLMTFPPHGNKLD